MADKVLSRIVPASGLPRGELGYAERTTDDTTTNTTLASASANKISGLAVTVIGAGRPVEVEFWCSGVRNATANNWAGASIVQDGTSVKAAVVFSPNTGIGVPLVVKTRLVLTAGQSYTFEVGKYGQAGTTTYSASAVSGVNLAMYLAVTER
jgi:hypothetical protein